MTTYDMTLDPISPDFNPFSWGPQLALPLVEDEPVVQAPTAEDLMVARITLHAEAGTQNVPANYRMARRVRTMRAERAADLTRLRMVRG